MEDKIVVLSMAKDVKNPTIKDIRMFGMYEIPGTMSHKDIKEFITQLESESGLDLEWVWAIDSRKINIIQKSFNVYEVE